jgi:hypothetical protein
MKNVDVKEFLESSIEDTDTPNRLLEWVRKNKGMTINMKTVLKAPEGFTINHGLSTYYLVDSKDTIACDITEPGVVRPRVVSPERFQELNPEYFGARYERNKIRRALLGMGPSMQNIAASVSLLVEAENMVKRERKRLVEILGHEGEVDAICRFARQR